MAFDQPGGSLPSPQPRFVEPYKIGRLSGAITGIVPGALMSIFLELSTWFGMGPIETREMMFFGVVVGVQKLLWFSAQLGLPLARRWGLWLA
jgi:hypothetical protein